MPSSSLRKQPIAANRPPLFAIQRTLSLQSDIATALPLCAQRLRDARPWCEAYIAYTESGGDMAIAATAPPDSAAASRGARVRLGAIPCGAALEKEALVLAGAGGGRRIIEAPIQCEGTIVGAAGLSFDAALPQEEQDLAADLVQWTCYLIGEAADLRAAFARRARELSREPTLEPAPTPRKSGAANAREAAGDVSGSLKEISFHGIIGSSDRMKAVFRLIEQVAGTDATVLVTGESGTGKELVAKAIHDCSGRAEGPFVAVNCSALPESIIESELFGHEKGAFTGAIAARQGRFEAARNGTLFLDEIGDLSPAVQVKLLRILQERSFERVGGNKTIKTNARIVVATHRDLRKEVSEGRFREDLYFRLNVFPIQIPPLRERGADILLLADWFAEKCGAGAGKQIRRISSPALDLLMIYHWPGNVRELENCVARACILSTDGVIHSYHLPPSLQSATSTGTEPASTFDGAIARLEKEMLVEALKIERGNAASAARRLGITERRIRLAMRQYKLNYHSFRTKM
ncbi:sigma-54 dependent transcriptional regulator [bacterium]|nr:sigma-54 dependent transcriptional regulator [bacterium]